MKKLVVFYLLLISISLLPFIAHYTPGTEPIVIIAAWTATALVLILSVYVLFFRLPGTLNSKVRKRMYSILIGLFTFLFLAFEITMLVSYAAGNAMWPRKLVTTIELPARDLYVFSYSGFPDPGENMEIKREHVWLPVLEKIYEARDFQYTGMKKEEDKVVFLSSTGRKINYFLKNDSVTAE
jgi:hypothetical protein